MKSFKETLTTQNMVIIAMLAALATVMYMLIEIPIIPFAPHLKVNFADVPAVLGGLLISPFASVIILFIRCLIHLFRTSTFGIGEAVDFIVGMSILLPFIISFDKMKKKNKFNIKTSYIIAFVITIICSIIGGFIANAIFYPLFISLIGKTIESTEAFISYMAGTAVTNIVRSCATLGVVSLLMPFMKRFKKIIKSSHK